VHGAPGSMGTTAVFNGELAPPGTHLDLLAGDVGLGVGEVAEARQVTHHAILRNLRHATYPRSVSFQEECPFLTSMHF